MTEADATKWKQTYVYGLPHERLSMTFLPANDHDNGWEPSQGVGGAELGVPPKTLWYLTDALGSTLSLLEKDGRQSVKYHYDEFGIPLDDKKFDVNWPGPDNLFGYTGLGYEYYSELTYARARYYQPEIGRFISEDPYKGDLWNPQSQNRFAYVENNPIIYIDPSGNKVWLIHGTWSDNDTWTSDFEKYVEKLFNETSDKLEWTGANKKGDRSEYAEYFAEKIYEWHKENPKDPIRLVGHSHGGNIAIMVANLLEEEGTEVETLITIATPVRGYKLEADVGQHIHVYNNKDAVQMDLGGSMWLFGQSTTRKFKNAENVRAKDAEKTNGKRAHSNMHSNVKIWEKYIEPKLKK